VDNSVRAYLSAGVPKDKLVVGVPFYGRAFGGVKDVNHGLGQSHDPAALPKKFAGREWTFRNISTKHVGNTGQRFWHDASRVPWLYDATTGVFVTYDDADSIRAKADYVRANNLGGVMIWEMSHDDAQYTLVRAIHAGLRNDK
jgi:chitinase